MSPQTPMNGNGHPRPPGRQVARSAADLWSHALTLIELQGQLLFAETGEGVRRAKAAALLIVIGSLLGIVTLPMVLLGVVYVLVDIWNFSRPEAFGLVAGLTALIAAGLVAAGWRHFRGGYLGIPHSRQQARLNWSWLKETMRPTSRSPDSASAPSSNGINLKQERQRP